MFRKDLERRAKEIFQFEKVTYLAPSDTFEQDTLFIRIHNARTRVSGAEGGREHAKVNGSFLVYSQGDRLPYGFFAKRVENALPTLTKPFLFMNMDTDNPESPARLQNIHERVVDFVFLYDSQYDPDKGELDSIELSLTIED